MTLKRTMCALLAATMLIPSAVMAETAASAAEVDVEESTAEVSAQASYGLADNIQDGVILHCFDWKYNDIKAELPGIAAAGFTSVQTSPAQPDGSGAWYWLYQPKSFSCGTNGLGTKAELQALCDEAANYGIKVIVDVVANHLNGNHSSIQEDLRDSQYWHTYGEVHSWADRYQVTHGEVGMPDLATENPYVQQCVKNYILELKGMGVDGIRWDAVKHIGLPSEGDNFLKVVTNTGLYNYGEILVGPDDRKEGNEALMKEYTNYMSVTDNTYGNDHRNTFNGGNVMAGYGNWVTKGLTSDKVVYWSESHDTWANAKEGDYSWNKSQNVVDRAYAAVATRNKACALYFSRPFSNPEAKENTHVGDKGSTHYTAKEVAEVNKFHNAMIGKEDYYSASNGCAVITRKGGGAVIIKGSGSGGISVDNAGKYAKPGTYTDKVSGGTFTVTETTISGNIGESGIAVIYDDVPSAGVYATPADGTSFTDTLTVTLKATNVTGATYTTSEGDSGSYTDGKTIVVGSSTAEGSTVTVTLSGTGTDGSTASAKYTYKKTPPKTYPTLNGGGFVFDNSTTNWSTVNAYVYDESGSTTIQNSAWPGKPMTDCGNGYWKYELDSAFANSSNVQVIFNNGSEKIPAGEMTPGFKMTSTDKKLYEDSWKDLPNTPVNKISVTLSASASSVSVGQAVTLTAKASNATGSVTYTFSDGSTQIASSSQATATWTPTKAGSYTITVTAKDSSGSATATTSVTVTEGNVPMVNVDKASGTSFTEDTMSLKLTLANAATGTYCVDDGPVKEFSGSKTISIGEGKIGDSTVTVKTTATQGSTTKTYTYTYNKKYVKKTSSSSSVPSAAAPTSDKYATNPNGQKGKQKTITSVSDFTEDMIIAQGVANDDPAAFRGTHEAPKFDPYALYAAWDDTNLYIGIQYTNVIDVVDPAQESPQTGRGKPNGADADIPQMILLDLGTGDYTDGSTNSTDQTTVWNTNITFGGDTKVDKIIMYSPKKGIDNYAIFPVSNGVIDYTNKIAPGYQKPLAGASLTWEDGFFCSNMYGVNKSGNSYTPADLEGSSWTDFLTANHIATQDTFGYMTMPLEYLGVTASQIASNGIGLMAVSTYGSSGIGCLPHDTCMLDNAKEPYVHDESTSGEKSDADQITVALARVGAGGDTPIPPSTPLQVNFGADRSAPQYTTTALTLKGIGYGGTAPYKYQFSVDGSIVKVSNTTDTYSWTPTTAGPHTMECVITDSTGKTATSSKTFTAETQGDDPIPTPLVNNSTVNKQTVTVNNPITMTASASGGTAPYTYAFYYKKASASSWTTKLDFGSTTSTTFTPGSVASYKVKIDVKDSTGKVVSKEYDIESISGTVTALTNNSSLSASSVAVNGTVTINCKASGGAGSYQYAIYYKRSGSSSWSTKQDYSTNASATFKPGYEDTYQIMVNVMDANGTVVSKTLNLQVGNTALKNNSSVASTSITLGNSITVKGAATGGTSPYTYSYYFKKASQSEWTTKTADTTATSVTIKPGSAVDYNVKVVVKDKAGKTASKEMTVKVTSALSNTSTVASSSIILGNSITVKGSATGGTSPYTYSYYFKKASQSEWTTKTADTTATSVTIKPGSAVDYNVKVVVKDKAGKTASKEMTVKVTNALSNTSTVASSSITLGNSITVKGAATGGTSPYTYSYYFKQASQSEWTTKSANTTATSVTIKPGSAVDYNVKVVVKDKAGKTATKTMTVKVTSALSNTSTVASSSIVLGNSITVKGAATGGTSPYTYSYYFKQASQSEWTTKSANTTATSVTIKPGSAVDYNVKVVVKDKAGKTATKTMTVKVTNALKNTSSVASTSITLGNSVTVKGAATGGTSPYTYSYYFKQSSSSTWTTKTANTTSTSVSIKPGSAVNYDFKVVVKDKAGKTAEKTMTVKVTQAVFTNNSSVSATTITLGSSITVKGAASNGTTPYTYSYYFKQSSQSSWTCKEGNTTSTSVTIKPGSAVNYDIKVVAMDSAGKSATKTFTVKVNKALSNTSTVASTSINLGHSINITGAATGGSGSYTYSYYFKKASQSDWSTKLADTTTKSVTITPGSAVTYNVKVVVKDSTGKTATKEFTVKVNN